jgi:hypothetical protein
MVVSLPDREALGAAGRLARRQVATAGIGNVLDIADALSSADATVTEERARELLHQVVGIEFLGPDWFTVTGHTGGLIASASRKMLAVTAPLDVATMREGIKRALRFRESVYGRRRWVPSAPPREVLAHYYRGHPTFVIDAAEQVRPTRPLDYRAELGGTEQVIVGALRSDPTGVLGRIDLVEACIARGAKSGTVAQMLTYSPVVRGLGSSLWTLRGTIVDPAAVEAIREANALRPREQRVVDFGWTTEGRLWVAFRLPTAFDSAPLNIPAAVARFIAGREFVASSEDGSPSGAIRVYEKGLTTGHLPFLRRAGADPGDILLEKFDLTEASVILSVTDDDGLEELSPAA